MAVLNKFCSFVEMHILHIAILARERERPQTIHTHKQKVRGFQLPLVSFIIILLRGVQSYYSHGRGGKCESHSQHPSPPSSPLKKKLHEL